jgi:tetratricopeptide (TPR) repeat protein
MTSGKRLRWQILVNALVALIGIFICFKLAVDSAKGGIARLYSTAAIAEMQIGPADTAVRIYPSDPEPHYTRALSLVNLNRLPEGINELREAIRLRPHHYYEWLDLGVTLDRVGDLDGAMAALKESVRLAPGFAQPRWQFGNLLIRQTQYEAAFVELRAGAKSNPSLFQALMALGWSAADGDVPRFEQLVQPDTSERHFLVASFLAKQGMGADSARQIKLAGQPSDRWERDVLNEAIIRLLSAELFSDAFTAWAATHDAQGGDPTRGELLNAAFTNAVVPDDPGFGWQVTTLPGVAVALDPAGPAANGRSARFEFAGSDTSGHPLIHQLVLLHPNTRYSLSFSSKAEELVSGGAVVITIAALKDKASRILARSDSLAPGTREWKSYAVDFSSDADASAVDISLQRLPCSQTPCPIFGKLWLGGFSLKSLSEDAK